MRGVVTEDPFTNAVHVFSDPMDMSNDWILVAEPPLPTVSCNHIDPSQHSQVELNHAVHGAMFGRVQTLHIKSLSDDTVVLRNIGTVSVERAVQRNLGSSAIELERSKMNPQSTPTPAAAPAPSPLLDVPNPSPITPPDQQNVVTLLRVDFSPPPVDTPYNPRITMDVLRFVVSNVGFFNVIPFEAPTTWKTATIAIRDAISREPPGKQSVTIECLPSYFYKPPAYCEPVLYTQRAAIENRFEFIFQRLKTMCCSPGGGDIREKMPLCVIEVFPTSGWLPRDTLMLRLSGSLYVLTQDGQVICNKEVVCKQTVVTTSSIRAEVTKDCKGATWAKVAGFLALVSYHFDMKDFGKDAVKDQLQPLAMAGNATANATAPPAVAATPNTVPQHDRVLSLQITEPTVKDIEGRTESWNLLQRISYSGGITSDQ
jgi:hypothetical protein